MKNFKKIMFGIVLSLTFLACSDEEPSLEVLNIKNLKNDSRLKSYIEENQKFINNISDIKTVNKLLKKENLNNQELEKLSIAIGFGSLEAYLKHYNNQTDILISLENEYKLSTYSKEDFKNILLDNGYYGIAKSDDCSESCTRTARNCIIGAAAVATIGHVACLSADVTVIVGVICHAAVAVLQVVVQDECLNQQVQCYNACNSQ